MPIDFPCPYCGRIIEAPDEVAGIPGTCRFCGATVVPPSAPGQPAELLHPGNPDEMIPEQPSAPAAPISVPIGYLDAGTIIGEAWEVLRRHWPLVLLSEVIAGVIILAAMAIPFFIYIAPSFWTGVEPPLSFGYVLVTFAISLVLSPLVAGPLFVVDRLLTRGEESIGAVFLGFRRYGAILVFTFLFTLPTTVLQALQVLFQKSNPALASLLNATALVVFLFMYVVFRLGLMEIVDRGAGGVEALNVSWEATKGYRAALLGTWILLGIVSLVGVLACGVGTLFTMLFLPVGEVLIYRHLRGLHGRVE